MSRGVLRPFASWPACPGRPAGAVGGGRWAAGAGGAGGQRCDVESRVPDDTPASPEAIPDPTGELTGEAATVPASGIDPTELAITLKVLAGMSDVDQTHPDYVAVRQATAAMFKAVKKVRRREIRDAIAQADREVVAATATGAPDRIDDETRGIPISTATTAPTAGTLLKARGCYICKQPYTLVDAFYHQLCPTARR